MDSERMIWYSSFSTGIFEVDNQHGNIDTLLNIYMGEEGTSLTILDELQKLIEIHFHFEENLLGDNFPQSHRDAHKEFLEELEKIVEECHNGTIRKEIVSDTLRMKLIQHVRIHDIHLKEYMNDD